MKLIGFQTDFKWDELDIQYSLIKKKAQPKKEWKNLFIPHRIYCFVYMGFKMFWFLKGCEFSSSFSFTKKKENTFSRYTIHTSYMLI